jgi:hypothetical protein
LERSVLPKSVPWRENLRDLKAQESKRLRPELNIWEAERSTAFSGGKSRWSANIRLEGLIGKRQSGKIHTKV